MKEEDRNTIFTTIEMQNYLDPFLEKKLIQTCNENFDKSIRIFTKGDTVSNQKDSM